jgi:REP element-mobilizing transposase RayT
MRKKRKFYSGVLNHVYQRSLNGVNLFYEDEDFLVFYTIFSVCVRSSDVEALMLCIMFNHFHALLRARSAQLRNKPSENVEKSIALLMDIDPRLFGRLDEEEKETLRAELDELKKIVTKFQRQLSK